MSGKNTNKICDLVLEKLLATIEKGVVPWHKPWVTGGFSEDAISHTTGKPYSLLNQILLDFRPGEYLTFNQVTHAGGKVKKGAKSNIIVFWQCGGFREVSSTKAKDLDDMEVAYDNSESTWVEWQSPVLKYYRVFHIDDCEDIEPKHTAKPTDLPLTHFNRDLTADNIANEYCIKSGVKLINKASNLAYYDPLRDIVSLPLLGQFESEEMYYATLFHELTHSTGHKSRLNRFKESGSIRANKGDYSREELIAEIGAATALSALGMDNALTIENNAAYLDNWGKYIASDPMAFIVAAGRAEKAYEMIFSLNQP